MPRHFVHKIGLFKDKAITSNHTYNLICDASGETLDAVLTCVYDPAEKIKITTENVDEVANLCKELGVTSLDDDIHAFQSSNAVLSSVIEGLNNHDKLLRNLEQQLNKLLSDRKEDTSRQESTAKQVETLKLTVDVLSRQCKEQIEASRKAEQAIKELAKQTDMEKLARGVAALKESERTASPSGIEFVYSDSNPLEGVVAYLTNEYGQTSFDVVASSVYGGAQEYDAKNVAELGTKSVYCSAPEPNSWIGYDFKDKGIVPTSYTVKSNGGLAGADHLKAWVAEVSDDMKSWTEIDRQDGNDLNCKYAVQNFRVSHVPTKSFRFFRIRQTGPNHRGQFYIILTSLEVFGTLTGTGTDTIEDDGIFKPKPKMLTVDDDDLL